MMNSSSRFWLLCSAALIWGLSSCNKDPIKTITPQTFTQDIPTTSNNTHWAARVTEVIPVATNEFVILGDHQRPAGDWDMYAVRYHLTQGIIWEQWYGQPSKDEHSVRICNLPSGIWFLGYLDAATPESYVYRMDLATGNSIEDRTFASLKISNLKQDANGRYYVIGGTSNVNINKPTYNSATDLQDFYITSLSNIQDIALAHINGDWGDAYGFGNIDIGYDIEIATSTIFAFGTISNANGIAGNNGIMIIKHKPESGIPFNQDYFEDTLSLEFCELVSEPSISMYHVFAYSNVNSTLMHQTYNLLDNRLSNNIEILSSVSTGIQNVKAVQVLKNNNNYLVVGNHVNGVTASVHLLDANFQLVHTTILNTANLNLTGNIIKIQAGRANSYNHGDNYVVPIVITKSDNSSLEEEISLVRLDALGNLVH